MGSACSSNGTKVLRLNSKVTDIPRKGKSEEKERYDSLARSSVRKVGISANSFASTFCCEDSNSSCFVDCSNIVKSNTGIFFGSFTGGGKCGGDIAKFCSNAFKSTFCDILCKEPFLDPGIIIKGTILIVEKKLEDSLVDDENSGCTAFICYFNHHSICSACLGDSQGIISFKNAENGFRILTDSHNCRNPQERERVVKAGGVIQKKFVDNVGRVGVESVWESEKSSYPGIPFTRCLGFRNARNLGLSNIPQITFLTSQTISETPSRAHTDSTITSSKLDSPENGNLSINKKDNDNNNNNNEHEEDDSLSHSSMPSLPYVGPPLSDTFHSIIVAARGFWQVVEKKEASDIVRSYACAQRASSKLVQLAEERWLDLFVETDLQVIVLLLDNCDPTQTMPVISMADGMDTCMKKTASFGGKNNDVLKITPNPSNMACSGLEYSVRAKATSWQFSAKRRRMRLIKHESNKSIEEGSKERTFTNEELVTTIV